MPTAPQKKRRPWKQEYKPQQRVVDMSWFYNNRKWRNFSIAFKQRHPLCIRCEEREIVTPSTVTDHKVRFVDGGPGFNLDDLKDEYFDPLCDQDHNSKSGKEAHGFKRGMG